MARTRAPLWVRSPQLQRLRTHLRPKNPKGSPMRFPRGSLTIAKWTLLRADWRVSTRLHSTRRSTNCSRSFGLWSMCNRSMSPRRTLRATKADKTTSSRSSTRCVRRLRNCTRESRQRLRAAHWVRETSSESPVWKMTTTATATATTTTAAIRLRPLATGAHAGRDDTSVCVTAVTRSLEPSC
eukprot:Amastigsp_a340083_59.p3 type:complete len:183 gc:universal Amastigsp_a340083_59:669-121(-)